ncbi:DUF6895 family protein [Kitasatospora sp. NPDC006697]|uniref:DUF6895 family protein n=1 Tax=Kitasatospora sp. NPDC006697 TaxID=3364020 RepID=UPI0036B91B92
MGTRSAGLDRAVLTRLSAGALDWISRHSAFLDTPSGIAELPVTPRVKALLQLAMLRRHWSLAAPAAPALAAVDAIVRRVWQRPEYAARLTDDPRYARQFQLMFAALAPAGSGDRLPAAVLAELSGTPFLTSRRKPPYLHLETRYYADLAGAAHRLAPYRELYEASALARHGSGLPVGELEVCNVTHTLFYLSDFGLRDPGLTERDRDRARRTVCRLTEKCAARGEWDLTGKLVLAQHCLGLDPLETPSGAAGLRLLAEAQTADGAIPGRSATDRAPGDPDGTAYFRRSYQSTVVAALTVACTDRSAAPAESLVAR